MSEPLPESLPESLPDTLPSALPLMPIMGSGGPQEPRTDPLLGLAETILRVFLAEGLNVNTRAARRSDLIDFCAYRAVDMAPGAVASLLQLSSGELRALVEEYRSDMRKRRLSDATVNRRLITVRRLLGTCRDLGASVPDPKTIVIGEKVRAYRDTRGPGVDAVVKLLDSCNRDTALGKRDYALLCLMFLSAFRRGEVVNMDAGDVDLRRKRVRILGKGKGTQYDWFSIHEETYEALIAHLDVREGQASAMSLPGSPPRKLERTDPLFVSLSPTRPANSRLSGRGLHSIVATLSLDVLGEHFWPHSLRHTAITEALRVSGGDVSRVQGFSRHSNMETLKHYDDNRQDHHEAIGKMVGDELRRRRTR